MVSSGDTANSSLDRWSVDVYIPSPCSPGLHLYSEGEDTEKHPGVAHYYCSAAVLSEETPAVFQLKTEQTPAAPDMIRLLWETYQFIVGCEVMQAFNVSVTSVDLVVQVETTSFYTERKMQFRNIFWCVLICQSYCGLID